MPRPSDIDSYRATPVQPKATDVERGLARPVREDSALEQWTKRRGDALDFRPTLDEQPTQLPQPDGLKAWAQQHGYGLDFEPHYDHTATSRSAEPKGARLKERTGKAMFSDPRLTARLSNGPGLIFVGAKTQNYARAETIRAIEAVGREWQNRHPHGPRIRVGGIGNVYGGPLTTGRHNADGTPQYHKSHDIGVDVDVRVMRNDNREADTKLGAPSYSAELTTELIVLFQQQTVLPVNVIFFGNTSIPGVRYEHGHEDHFHVRFMVPR